MYELRSCLKTVFYATIIPGTILISWLTGLIALPCLTVSLFLCFLLFIVIPLAFRFSVTIQRGILFLPFIRYPKGLDLTKPESIGLYATRNFYLTVPENDDPKGVRIGVWHVLPNNVVRRFKHELGVAEVYNEEEAERLKDTVEQLPLTSNTKTNNQELQQLLPELRAEFPVVVPENKQLFYERLLRVPDSTVILYLHGNTATRGSGHRPQMYKVLRHLNYHVVAFDYRGYADSDHVPTTEEGVVQDSLTVFEYLSNITTNPIYIWGHSLGTGVATNMCSRLAHLKERGPRGVILESPFTNIREEIRLHPFSRPFRNLPWFNATILEPMYGNNLRFESDNHINQFPQPIMILHAEDDRVVPIHLGYQLYRSGVENRDRSWGPIEFHRFDGSRGYGHKYMCQAPEIPRLVQNFVESFRNTIY